MTIRRRTLAMMGLTLASLVGVLYLALSGIVRSGFDAVERRDAARSLEQVRQAFTHELDVIQQKTHDWAHWDDTYAFVLDGNDAYRRSNLENIAFTGMNLDFLVIADAGGRLVTGLARAERSGPPRTLAPAFTAAHFQPDSPLLSQAPGDPGHRGLLLTPGLPPALFCSLPITRTDGGGDIRGSLVFGRFFDAGRQEAFSRLVKLDVRFGEDGSPGLAAAGPEAQPDWQRAGGTALRTVDGATLRGCLRFPDYYGREGLVAEVSIPRGIHRQAQATLRALLIALIVAGVAFAAAFMALVERIVLRRVAALSADIGRIAQRFDFSARVAADGRDEIAALGQRINTLLAAVEQERAASRRPRGSPPAAPPRRPVGGPLGRDAVQV